MKLYYFKMYDKRALIRNFVPCYRKSDNVVGLYDLVNGVFYVNKGSGAFTKGDDVIPGVKINISNNDESQSQSVFMPVQQEMLTGDYISDKEYHNWAKLTINGTENWATAQFGTNSFVLAASNPYRAETEINVLSNYFKGVPYSDRTTAGNNIIYEEASGVNIYIRNTEFTTLDNFKAWLKEKYDAGNPVIIYYKITTPNILTLTTAQQEAKAKLTNMTLYQGVTNITNESSYPAILNLDYNIVEAMLSPTNPSPIKTVGDNINLIPTSADGWGQGSIDYTNGNNITLNTRIRTNGFIDVVGNKDYFVSVQDNQYCFLNILLYKNDGTFLKDYNKGVSSAINGATSLKVAFPSECKKIRITMRKIDNTSNVAPSEINIIKPKLEAGTVQTPWSEYNQGSVEVNIMNKNFINMQKKVTNWQGASITVENNKITFKGNSSGVAGLDYSSVQQEIKISKNSKVTYSSKYVSGSYVSGSTYYRLCLYYADGTYTEIMMNRSINTYKNDISQTITLEKDVVAYLIRGSGYLVTGLSGELVYEFQLEIGDTASDIVEQSSQTAIMPVQQEMLSGDYIDDVEHHEWKKLVLDGNENWEYDNEYKYFRCPSFVFDEIPSEIKVDLENQKSNYFKITNDWGVTFRDQTTVNIMYAIKNTGYKICIRNVNCTTVEQFKVWLKSKYDEGNPVIVYYKLAEPVDLELTEEQKTVKNTLINAYEPITNVYASDDLSLLKVYTTSIPSPKLPSKIYSSGDTKNQLEDLGTVNVDYNQGYFETTDTNFVLKPDFVYNLSFDYTVNSSTTDLYFTVSYKSNGEIFDITNASQYSSQTAGRNNIGFMVPANIPANSTLSIKFARTIIPANVSVTVSNISLTKGRFAADYQSPDIYNVYPTVTQKNIFNYNDIYYIRNENATLTYIQNGFSSEVVTTGEKSFFEFGFPNILQPGNKYAISYNSYGAIKSAKIYTMDKETGETLEQITTENGVFTAPSNLYDIKAEFILDDSIANNQVQVWNIQLESGEQVTEADTYASNSTDLTLDEPLRGIGRYRDLACLESPNILNPETQIAIVKGSTTYSLSQSGTTAYSFDYINEDNNVISSESMASGQFTTPDNCVKIKFDTTSDVITANKLQVNLGNTAMVYYPYINEPSVIRYVKESALSGSTSEAWADANRDGTDNTKYYGTYVPDIRLNSSLFCPCFANKYNWDISKNTIYCGGSKNIYIRVLKGEFPTLNDFKAWLKEKYDEGDPVIVDYILATPTVEPLSSDNISALQNLKTYEGVSNVFTNNSMPANINFSYISSQSEQEAKNAYVTLKCWSGHPMPYFVHSNYIDIPKETDKVFIWVRRKNNLFDLKIENLGDYDEDTPIDKGNPTVAITVGETTTTSITITANAIDTVSLKSIKFSKDNGETWEAEIPVDGLSSSATYTFAELQPSTVYQIRAEATNVNDIVGGITQQITTKTN